MLRILWAFMPSGLHRTYGAHHLHFITNSCDQWRPLLGTARARDYFLSLFEQTRQRYRFVVVGYVVIPVIAHTLRHPERPRFCQRAEGSRVHNIGGLWVGTGHESDEKVDWSSLRAMALE